MIPDIGNLLLYLALVLSIITAMLPAYAALLCYKTSYTFPVMKQLLSLKILWHGIACCSILSLLCLIYCYVTSDFSVLNVLHNSHTNKPLIYKISGAWGNHEGSMLLWIVSVSIFTTLFATFAKPSSHYIGVLALQALLNCCFIAFTIFVSSPFTRIFPAPINGRGLNPILQDIGLVMHPPTLYLGYVGLSICYSSCITGIVTNSIDRRWPDIIRPWCLLSWLFLTIGIALGSWWAYRELGWGGFWFWDPVENASLMPWLSTTALFHALSTYKKTGHMQHWCIMLAIMTFLLSLLGTFLVRSSIVTSVHSFAHDPERGVYILCFLGAVILLSFMFYAIKQPSDLLTPPPIFSIMTLMNINNLLLCVAVFTVALGTFYPIILDVLTIRKLSVGAPYFNKVFNPIALCLAIVCAFTSSILDSALGKKKILNNALIIFIAIVICVVICIGNNITSVLSSLGIISGLILIISMVKLFIGRCRKKLKISFIAMFSAHLGFGIAILAIAINSALQEEAQYKMKAMQSISFGPAKIVLQEIIYRQEANYIAQLAKVYVYINNKYVATLFPEVRFFLAEQQQTIETAIYKHWLYDLYIAVGEVYDKENGLTLNVYFRPMISFLWFGAVLIVIGGIFAILSYYVSRRKVV